MKAIITEAYGGVEEFKTAELETPGVAGNEVLVEVHAVAVNRMDVKVRAGDFKKVIPLSFPIIFGWDISGTVKEVGELVEKFKAGDEVVGKAELKKPGGFAEYIVMEDKLLVSKPDNVSFEEAAAVPLTSMTAWQMLKDKAEIEAGEKVFIHAGSGGVGSFAIQLAKYFGAEVTTTTSGKNVEFVKDLGADTVINYREEDFSERKREFDVVLDTLGGEIQEKSYDVLKPGGRLVSIAGKPDKELAEEKGVTAMYLNSSTKVDQLEKIMGLVSEGKVKPAVGQIFPFSVEGVQEAHKLSESGHAKGKIIVKIK